MVESKRELAFDEMFYKGQYQGLFLNDNNLVVAEALLPDKEAIPAKLNAMKSLDSLPLEITSQVALQLDVPSLLHFRLATRRTMRAVDSIPSFQLIRDTPNVLSAVMLLQPTHYSVAALASCLRTQTCHRPGCGQLGDYLHLLSCRRVCFPCLILYPGYEPMTAKGARDQCRRSETLDLDQFPHVTCPAGTYGIPPRYGEANLDRPEPVVLYDRPSVMAFSKRKAVWDPLEGRLWCIPDWNPEPEIYMVTVRVPCRDETTGALEEGIFCLACRELHIMMKGSHRRFTREGMRRHIEYCGPVFLTTKDYYWHRVPAGREREIEEYLRGRFPINSKWYLKYR